MPSADPNLIRYNHVYVDPAWVAQHLCRNVPVDKQVNLVPSNNKVIDACSNPPECMLVFVGICI